MTDNAKLTVVGAVVLALLVALVLLARSGSTGTTTDADICRDLMERNRRTAIVSPDNPHGVTERQYLARCEETNRSFDR